MSDPNERSSGRLVAVRQTIPTPVVLDCSHIPRAEGPRSRGKFVSAAQSLGVIQTTFERVQPKRVELVVALTEASAGDIREVARRMIALISALDPELQFDLSPPQPEGQAAGPITLVPRHPFPDDGRVAEIVQVINSQLAGIMKGVPKFQLLAA